MSTRHIAAEDARLSDLTPEGSSGRASKRFRQKLAADGFTVDEGFRLKPGYLYTVVRAISARVNQNYDGWPSDELKKSYKTFIGKPVFVNHENHDPTKARGVVVAARYAENGMDKYIEVVQEIDAGRFPKLAHEIKTGGLDSVSMGAEAGFTICSYCHNRATDLHDMCDHVKYHKGKTMRRFDRKTGSKEDVLVFESCHKISFFELSYVFEPADETAVASKVVVAGLHKTSGLECQHCGQPVTAHGEPWGDWTHDDPAHDEHHDADPGYYDHEKGQRSPYQQREDVLRDPEFKQWSKTLDKKTKGYFPQMTMEDLLDSWHRSTGKKPAFEHPESHLFPDESGQQWKAVDRETGREYHPGDVLTDDGGGQHVYHGIDSFPGKGGDNPASEGRILVHKPEYRPGPKWFNSPRTLYPSVFNADIVPHTEAWNPDQDQDPFDPRLIGASVHRHAGECPPGIDCSRFNQMGMEQITRDSPNNPVNQVSYDPATLGQPGAGSAGGAGGGGGGTPDASGILPGSRALHDAIKEMYPDLTIGGYRPGGDGYDEHNRGALDIMTTDDAIAQRVREKAFEHGAPYVIWQQQQWDAPWHNSGGVSQMEDRSHLGPAATQNHFDHVHIAPLNSARATIRNTTTPSGSTSGSQPAQRAAGKYTKEDFANAGGKKPWETDDTEDTADLADIEKIATASDDYWAWKREHGQQADQEHGAPPARENRSLKEWAQQQRLKERKLSGHRKDAGSLTDDYLDYMYGEYGGTDYEVPNHPMDIMYDEAHHGRGRTGPASGPSGPGGPPLHHSQRTAANVPRQLRGLVSTWTPYVNNNPKVNPDGLEAPPPDPSQPVFVHFQIPAADRQRKALRYHLNDPNDPEHDPSRPSLPRAEAARLSEQHDLWSIEQEDPVTGKRQVRGHTNQLHLTNVSFDINRSGQKATQTSGKKGVHAGVSGHMIPQPKEPLAYSNVEYNPFAHMDFVHRDDQTPIGDPDDWTRPRGNRAASTPSGYRSNGAADHVHLSPDMSMYAHRADDFGRDPQIVFPPHPAVNVANPDTVLPGIKPGAQHPEVAARTKDIMERRRQLDQAKGRSVVGMRKIARRRALKLAWGEQEAPMAVDTLREEGSAPEDDNNDDQRYVDPPEFKHTIDSPEELQTPDLSQAAQIDREQEVNQAETGDSGIPGPAEGGPMPTGPQQQYMTLKIPVPSSAPQVPMQQGPPQLQLPQPPITAALLDYFDGYYGQRVANWLDAIEDGRAMNPAEAADYRRQAAQLSTLENGRELSTTGRNPQKGTANMARTSIANRNKVATAGRRQHFAEGPLVDGGERGRNDQGKQEEAFLSQTPPAEHVDAPTDDTNISNTEHNLVARVQQGRAQLLRDAQQLARLQQRRAFDESGGPTAEVVDPRVNTGPEGEALTGDDFISADPNDGVVPTNPKDASLRAFQAFDGWLASKTGKSSRRHTEATIKKAAAAFSREAGISPQALFPALGIVLREARKNDKKANTKGAKMRKRADEKLEVAAPDGRVDVEAPVENVTSAEAQASQFDLRDFGDNAGDNVAKPDLSTDQNWAPGEASKSAARVKTAGGLLAMRCAEGMIAAGLESNSRERKYQLAAEFEQMNRGLIQDRVALLERFAAVRQADLRRVASGSSRGAARSPIPAGLGGGTRTAAAPQRVAAHDPRNDSSLFL